METLLTLFGSENFAQFDEYFKDTFKIIYPIAIRIICKNLNNNESLYKMMCRAASDESPSDYPFLFRFSYQLGGKPFNKVHRIAAAIHLLQTSTFVTDDIFDNSKKRGGRKTIHNVYGINNAIITAELLQTISLNTIYSEIMKNSFPHSKIVFSLFNEFLEDVYIGQYLDIYQSGKNDVSLDSYSKMIALTTGKFLSNLSRAGSLLANLPKLHVESLSNYGFYYGMALQICDDIIDVIYDSSLTMKSFACDIKCRRLRIPLILALNLSRNKDHDTLIQLVARQNRLSLNEIKSTINIIKECGAIDECKRIACQYILKAVEALSKVKNTFPKKMLEYLALGLLRNIGGIE